MFQKKITSLLLIILLLLLSACSKSLPDQMPDLGINSDDLEFNTYFKLTAPKECNTYQSGESVCLQVKNLSEKVWDYNITKDIQLYQLENNDWKKVPDNMKNIGATESTLGPRGKWPSDIDIVDVLPDVNRDQSTYLRVIIIFHEQTIEKEVQSKGAFVDVKLSP